MTWKTFLIRNQLLLVLLLGSVMGCSHGGPVPKWDGKIWDANHEVAGIRRTQDNEVILATDPAFDAYIAMSAADFRSFYTTYVLGCKEWKKGTTFMSAGEALDRFKYALKDLRNEEVQDLLAHPQSPVAK